MAFFNKFGTGSVKGFGLISVGAKLAGFIDSFTAANSASALPTTTALWQAVRGVWGITSNKAYAVSNVSSYAIATVDAKTEDVTVRSVTDNTGAGVGVSFWVTDANNWWGAYVNKTTTTGTPYICPSGGTVSGSNCNYSYGASAYGSVYYYCPGNYIYHGICCLLNGHEWVGCIGPNHAPGPTVYGCPSGGSLSGVTCYVSYAASLTTYYNHTLTTVKNTAGTITTVMSNAVANTTSNSDYAAYVQASTGPSSVTITAQMTSGGAVASATTPSGTPARTTKHGMLTGPSTLNTVVAIEQFNYTPN